MKQWGYLFLIFSVFQGAPAVLAEVSPSRTSEKTTSSSLASDLERSIRSIFGSRFKVTTYFPAQFAAQLERAGIKPKTLLKSLSGEHERRRSTGKSGSLFIRTQDKRFVIKSISTDEFETFVGMASSYFDYLQTHPSFLVPFFGLFEIDGGPQQHIIIMPNLVKPSLQKPILYDLKGRDKKLGHRPRSEHSIDDNNLPDTFLFGISHTTREILEQDVEFLQRNGLMDYSLFLVQEDSQLRQISIIDYLTYYSFKKQIANAFKSIRWNESQLSTMPPEQYAHRFKRLLDRLHQPWKIAHGCCYESSLEDGYEMKDILDTQ